MQERASREIVQIAQRLEVQKNWIKPWNEARVIKFQWTRPGRRPESSTAGDLEEACMPSQEHGKPSRKEAEPCKEGSGVPAKAFLNKRYKRRFCCLCFSEFCKVNGS